MIEQIPKAIRYFFQKLKGQGIYTPQDSIPEEEQSFPLTFSEQVSHSSVEKEDSSEPVEVKEGEEIVFEAFLDGVQRTMMLPYRILLPNGAQVPLHVAHIAAGVILRDKNGKLYTEPDLIASRLLLLGPFEGIRKSEVDIPLEGSNITWDTSEKTFAFPNNQNEWIVCDTTFRGTDEDRSERNEGALLGNEMFKEGLIRSRAQGRAAILRQRLELSVLAIFRSKYPDRYILIDGPLYFLDKWRRKAAKVLGPILGESRENLFEDKLLRNAIGLIKTHRLRPKHPGQIIRIGPNQRSPVFRISQEVDIKGNKGEQDEYGNYGGAHLTWYTRLRLPSSPPYGLQGLIRLDVHRITLGIDRIDTIDPKIFKDYEPIVNGITRGVWRESWPGIHHRKDSRIYTQIYPIEVIEKTLKGSLYPKRLLAHIFNVIQNM